MVKLSSLEDSWAPHSPAVVVVAAAAAAAAAAVMAAGVAVGVAAAGVAAGADAVAGVAVDVAAGAGAAVAVEPCKLAGSWDDPLKGDSNRALQVPHCLALCCRVRCY